MSETLKAIGTVIFYVVIFLAFYIAGVGRWYKIGYNKGVNRTLDTVLTMMQKQVKDTSVVSAVEIQTEKDTVFYILSNKTIK